MEVNGTTSTLCQNCNDYKAEIQYYKRLAAHWKTVAKKYEPTRQDPKWSVNFIKKVKTEVLDIQQTEAAPLTGKMLKRNYHNQIIQPMGSCVNDSTLYSYSISMRYM